MAVGASSPLLTVEILSTATTSVLSVGTFVSLERCFCANLRSSERLKTTARLSTSLSTRANAGNEARIKADKSPPSVRARLTKL